MTGRRGIAVGIALAAFAATLIDAGTDMVGLWQALSPLARVLILAVETTYPLVVGAREAVPFIRKHLANSRVAEAFESNGAPELRVDAPKWIFKVVAPGKLGLWLEGLEEVLSVRHAVAGKMVVATYLKTSDTADAWVQMTRVRALETRGLLFLSGPMRDAILWNIIVDRLVSARAPQEAVLSAKGRLEALEGGPLYDCLFNNQRLAAVDVTPVSTQETYFARYFQKLMVSLAEARFAESGGLGSQDAHHALMTHLNWLASGRVIAGTFRRETHEPQPEGIRTRLPVELRAGPQHRVSNDVAKRFNKRAAVRAVVLVADGDGLNQAQAFEQAYGFDHAFRQAGWQHDFWTPYLEHGAPYCFLCQCR